MNELQNSGNQVVLFRCNFKSCFMAGSCSWFVAVCVRCWLTRIEFKVQGDCSSWRMTMSREIHFRTITSRPSEKRPKASCMHLSTVLTNTLKQPYLLNPNERCVSLEDESLCRK
jgi:hypothetical protein